MKKQKIVKLANGSQIKIIKNLNVVDKWGEWVEIEWLDGPNEGSRSPVTLEEIKKQI